MFLPRFGIVTLIPLRTKTSLQYTHTITLIENNRELEL
jgi:hypothetical protein